MTDLGASMASKRSTRASRPVDQERVSSLFDRRDDAATRRRVLLTAAAVLVVLTGAFAGMRWLNVYGGIVVCSPHCGVVVQMHAATNLAASKAAPTGHFHRFDRTDSAVWVDTSLAGAGFRAGGRMSSRALHGVKR